MCCTVIEGKCKRCISDPWTVHSAAEGAYVKEIPRDLISHFNYCRQWRGSLAGALKLLLVFAIILCEFELCCYCFICSCSDHHANSNLYCTDIGFALPHGPKRGLRLTQNAYFSLLTHTKQLLLLVFCDLTAENGPNFRTQRQKEERTDEQTDVEVEIVI